MSHLRDALEILDNLAGVLRRSPGLPKVPPSEKALRVLEAQDAPPARPPGAVLDQLKRQLITLAQEKHGYAMVPSREMRHVPWLLWASTEPIAKLPGLLEELIGRALRRRSVLSALIEAWVHGCSRDAPLIAEAAAGLRWLIKDSTHPAMKLWREADDRIQLFDPVIGPRELARLLVDGDESVESILANFGFDDPFRAVSGFLRVTQTEVTALIADRMTKAVAPRAMDRMVAFFVAGGNLRFKEPEAASGIARAMIWPWIRGQAVPSEPIRERVQAFLLQFLGDPRLRPQLWAFAGEETIAQMRRWLTKASLDVFFRLIRDHALDHQWRYREAFWSAYLKDGAIEDAWLAFAPSVHADARSIRELRGAFGRLDGYGGDRDHSVLLMRIGKLVFCEWSHNGALRAWPIDWKAAPKLAQVSYLRKELQTDCLPFPPYARGKGGTSGARGLTHSNSDRAHWQQSVAELIARRTQVKLQQRDYMPR